MICLCKIFFSNAVKAIPKLTGPCAQDISYYSHFMSGIVAVQKCRRISSGSKIKLSVDTVEEPVNSTSKFFKCLD